MLAVFCEVCCVMSNISAPLSAGEELRAQVDGLCAPITGRVGHADTAEGENRWENLHSWCRWML